MRRGESRLPASMALAAAIASQALLSEQLVPGPRFLLPGIEALLLVGLLAADPNRVTVESKDLRLLSIVLIAVVALANAASLVALVNELVNGGGGTGKALLSAATGVWLTNVIVFGLAYWELDRGGPLGRGGARPAPEHPDLWFPQDGDAQHAAPREWKPVFVDYLFVSLTAATAFSPTDTMPLTPRAKLMMGLQSLLSLLTVGLVAARAVNILR
ncbi:MAG: hypothetical protein JWM02_2549 [Frankiales bacterium]|nr:hypothetical protein [Frankiales bacterium]